MTSRAARWFAAGALVVALLAGAGVAVVQHRSGQGGAEVASPSVVASASASVAPTTTSPTTSAPAPTPAPTPTPTPTPTFDLTANSATDPASIWVVVNKQHPVAPLDYAPTDLVTAEGATIRAVVVPDLEAMFAAAAAEGVHLGIRTAYRSYDQQAAIRADVEARRGWEHAEKYSARPGYSEHQTGLSFDLHGTSRPSCDLSTCFADTVEGQWVAAHAWEYGFLVRYQPGNEAVTGYSAEAWHLRFVGRDLAAWMQQNGVTTLEEAFGVTGGASYPS